MVSGHPCGTPCLPPLCRAVWAGPPGRPQIDRTALCFLLPHLGTDTRSVPLAVSSLPIWLSWGQEEGWVACLSEAMDVPPPPPPRLDLGCWVLASGVEAGAVCL